MAKKKRTNFKSTVSKHVEQKRQEQNNFGYLKIPQGVSIFKPTPTERRERHRFDIIPYWVKMKNHPDRNDENGAALPGSDWYRFPFKIHRSIGADNIAVVCPTTFGKPCPICEQAKKMKAEGADKEDVKALYPKRRALYNIIPIDHKEYDEEIHILDQSTYLFHDVLADEIEEDPDNGRFPDIEEGLTLATRWDGKSFGKNEFSECSRLDFEERDEAYDESIIDDAVCLEEILEVKSYKELEAMFYEVDPEDLEDDAPEEVVDEPGEEQEPEKEEKQKRRKKKTTQRKTQPAQEEEEEEEEKPPAKKTRKRKPAPKKKPVKKEEEEDGYADHEPEKVTPQKSADSDECPYGHEFGVDFEDKDECAECPKKVWDKCLTKNEELDG